MTESSNMMHKRRKRAEFLKGKSCVDCSGAQDLKKVRNKPLYRCGPCRRKLYPENHHHKEAEIAFVVYVEELTARRNPRLVCVCGSRKKVMMVKIHGKMLPRCESCRAEAFDHTKEGWFWRRKASAVWRGQPPTKPV